MLFKLITDLEEMKSMSEPWNTLLELSAIHVPFLRHEYQQVWWETKGGGEWKRAELSIVVAYQDEKIIGIAPLFFSRNREDEPALLIIGSIEVSDYLDMLVRPADLPGFMEGLFKFLDSEHLPAWKVLDCYNLLEDSPTITALEEAANYKGWKFDCQRLQHSPYIDLPGDWEVYLCGIDKKQRHEIRRKMRRLEESGQSVRIYVVEDKAAVEIEAEAFLNLMAQDPEKAAFLTPPMRDFMTRFIRCAFDTGCLQLAFIEVNGEKAAGYLNFNYLNRIWVYNSGMDRHFTEYSPGWVLLGYLLKWANEQHISEFDFMRGDEDYKYRFGAKDRFVVRATVRR